MKIILIILFIAINLSCYAQDLINTLDRTSNFNDNDFICVSNSAEYISFNSLLNKQIITDYQKNDIPFTLYIYNGTIKEKVINENPIKLLGSNEFCDKDNKKYRIEIEITKDNIALAPENVFYNTLNVSTFSNNQVLEKQDFNIIYTTQAVGIKVSSLQDFSLIYNPSAPNDISVEHSFCVYTDGIGNFNLNVNDGSGNAFELINDNTLDTIPYQLSFRSDSFPKTLLYNNVYIMGITGNTSINCSSGEQYYIKIDISNNNLVNKMAGIYLPNNINKTLYMKVQLDIAP